MTLSTHTKPADTATVTATIVFGGAATADETIVITDAAGTSKTYTAKNSSSTSDLEFIKTAAADAATALKACIEHANGHNGSITVADDSSGTLTLTLLVDSTYRFKNKASIVEGLSNVTVTQFGSTAGVEDKDGGVILNAGTPDSTQAHMNAPSTAKSIIEIVAGRKLYGAHLGTNAAAYADTGATSKHQPGLAKANSSGTFAYNPSESIAKRATSFAASAPDSGFLIRGGVVNKVSGTSLNPILSGSDTTSRRSGNIHKVDNTWTKGTWATQIFDMLGGGLLQSDGTDKSGITGWAQDASNKVTYAADQAADIGWGAAPRNGEIVILFDFTTFTNNYKDYSAITG